MAFIDKYRKFMNELDERRERKEVGTGTIWLKDEEEFKIVAEYFHQSKIAPGMVSPGGAAGFLGVSRAMIHQLEKEGVIRAYRYIYHDTPIKNEPYWQKLLFSTVAAAIYIPREDLVKYKEERDKKRKK